MKKLLIIPALALFVFAGHAAAEGGAWIEWNKTTMTRVVDFVLEKNKAGYDADEIVAKLLNNQGDLVKKEVKKEYKTDKEYSDKEYLAKKKELAALQEKAEKLKKKNIKETHVKKFVSSDRTLRPGYSGEDIQEIQEIMNALAQELGFDVELLEVDGKYGPATYRMVKWIQKYQGISDDGIVGPKTKEKLENLLKNLAEKKEKYDKKHEEKESTIWHGPF